MGVVLRVGPGEGVRAVLVVLYWLALVAGLLVVLGLFGWLLVDFGRFGHGLGW